MAIANNVPKPVLANEPHVRDGIRVMRRAFVNTDAKCLFGLYGVYGKRSGRFYWAIGGHKAGLVMRCMPSQVEGVAALLLDELRKLRAMGRAAAA